jgi:hypothetical protein
MSSVLMGNLRALTALVQVLVTIKNARLFCAGNGESRVTVAFLSRNLRHKLIKSTQSHRFQAESLPFFAASWPNLYLSSLHCARFKKSYLTIRVDASAQLSDEKFARFSPPQTSQGVGQTSAVSFKREI